MWTGGISPILLWFLDSLKETSEISCTMRIQFSLLTFLIRLLFCLEFLTILKKFMLETSHARPGRIIKKHFPVFFSSVS